MATIPTFWNGEPCRAKVVTVVVGKAPRETWWCAKLEGQQRQAVEVEYAGQKFYLDNEDGSGWWKVTQGHGSPFVGHSSIPVEAVYAFTEEACPGHVASDDDPKVCKLCGTHIDSLRPDEPGEQS